MEKKDRFNMKLEKPKQTIKKKFNHKKAAEIRENIRLYFKGKSYD